MNESSAEGNSVKFWLRVKPRSRRQGLGRSASGELFLQVTAPPADQRANEAVADFLAEALRLPRSSVEILAGSKARRKLIQITGLPARDAISRLERLASERPD
jgi:uncharacterized protein